MVANTAFHTPALRVFESLPMAEKSDVMKARHAEFKLLDKAAKMEYTTQSL